MSLIDHSLRLPVSYTHLDVYKRQKVIFAGPCICKKLEADHVKELGEVAITFKDLKNWFEKENIHPEQLTPAAEDHFIPWQAGIGSLYPVEGGMLPGIDGESKKIVKMAFSDLSNIKEMCIRDRLIILK